jgi:hypothetical protein
MSKEQQLQDELDYLELIAQVALIDEAAAEYMQGPMRKIGGFGACSDLWEVVVWANTAQGSCYWYNIASQL